MGFFFTAALKTFKGGEEEPPKGPPKDAKEAALPSSMNHEEFEEYQRQLLEKTERDKAFAQRKAERAAVWMHLRDKYRLAQDERDDAQLHVAGRVVELPQELAPMVHNEEDEEEDGSAGTFAFLSKLRDVNLPVLCDQALGRVGEVKEKCAVM